MRAGGAALLLVCAAACEGNGLQRQDAVQLHAGTDQSNVFIPPDLWWLGDAVLYGTNRAASSDLWIRWLDGTPPRQIDSDVLGYRLIRDDDGSVRWIAAMHPDDTGTQTMILHALDGAVPVVVDRVITSTPAILEGSRCALMRANEAGRLVFWRGACNALRRAPSRMDVKGFTYGPAGHWYVVASLDGAVERGIHDLADDDTFTAVVPPIMPGFESLPGFSETAALESDTVGEGPQRICWRGMCRLLYDRILVGGGRRVFAFRPETGAEILMPIPANARPTVQYPGEVRVVSWGELLDTSDTSQDTIPVRYRLWDVATDRVKSCDVGKVSIKFQYGLADQSAFLYSGAQTTSFGMTVETVGDDACVGIEQSVWGRPDDLVSGPTHVPSFSPDGTALTWLQLGDPQPDLWLADGTGRNQRMVLAGRAFQRVAFAGRSDELLLRYGAVDGDALSIVALTEDGPAEAPLATQVFRDMLMREWTMVRPRALVVGTGFTVQDGAGDLSLIDLDTRSSRILDSGVISYAVDPAAVLYWVRGRYPSDRDGLWVRRLP